MTNKTKIIIPKSKWIAIGHKMGWLKTSQSIFDVHYPQEPYGPHDDVINLGTRGIASIRNILNNLENDIWDLSKSLWELLQLVTLIARHNQTDSEFRLQFQPIMTSLQELHNQAKVSMDRNLSANSKIELKNTLESLKTLLETFIS